MSLQIDIAGQQMGAIAHARQGGRENVMARSAQIISHIAPNPAAAPRAMY
jgi:hypothetical protein